MTIDVRTQQLRQRLGLIGMEIATKQALMKAVPEVDNIQIQTDYCRFTMQCMMTFGWTYERNPHRHYAGPYNLPFSNDNATPMPTPETLNAIAVAMRMEKP